VSPPESSWGGTREESPAVRIAEYLYRHEAEFAAGFLRDAGIPYLLQIDDAGGADAGVTIGRPATLWVRAEDEEDARALLALEGSPAEVPRAGAARASDERDAQAGPVGPRHPGPTFIPLCRAERVVAGVVALVLFGLASAGGEAAVPWVGLWESIALGLALVLGLSSVSGKTLGPVHAILRWLSGFAP
jgi:hypothetical protein